MKLTKRSRKLLLSAGMLAAVASIPPSHPAEAACSLTCPDGTVLTCGHAYCQALSPLELQCGRLIKTCP